MKSIILCEGRTDAGILKYYMERVNGWKDYGKGTFKIDGLFSRRYYRDKDSLTIAAMGGCNRITYAIEEIMKYNKCQFREEDVFSRIAVIVDNDDVNTSEKTIKEIDSVLNRTGEIKDTNIRNNEWIEFSFFNDMKKKLNLRLLPLIIPFDEKGAIETFILKSISDEDDYDKEIIVKGNDFIDTVDPDSRYLNHRRIITKAKYEVFFSVRATAEKHNDRDVVMKSIQWEKYKGTQMGFEKLRDM